MLTLFIVAIGLNLRNLTDGAIDIQNAQDRVILRLHFNAPKSIKCIYLNFSLITGKFKIDSLKKSSFSIDQKIWKFVKYNILLLKCHFSY